MGRSEWNCCNVLFAAANGNLYANGGRCNSSQTMLNDCSPGALETDPLAPPTANGGAHRNA